MRRIAALLLFASSAVLVAGDYFPPPDSAGGWRTLKDAAAIRRIGGMDPVKLDYAFEYASRSSQHGGLVVIRHGYLVYEKYYGRGNREATPAMASVGKAYTSIACAIMLREKHDQIPDGLETKVFNDKFLPEALPLDDPRKAEIKLGHLLSMASGLHGEGGNPGLVDFMPSVKLVPVPRPAERSGRISPPSAVRRSGQSGRGLFIHLAISAHCFNRAAPSGGHGDAAVHR